ncbi:hypothetical protein LTR10_023997 [Elasticomyces elasticus]|uniref:DUF7702 domain-containing protein n=1 Tax=Exophiala sideris TaxID=1016849 RepID=A0ABR0IUG0_9EURO|nr:hypothetical protein LTR10_023997 [Elasticomyces elasticus]KAK5020965.1 hypothetical protein LTS07_011322 [Exophiala sideris]KAK5028108.1 hypothetical protein LTR13_009337 [Exophiala sideris]KAK5048457.1 hypothetical protein LTR69_011347 [Exophiala sideris]KAK5176059.1 hypothetical protein LTR44_011386 [Eurotiomycetes sp. CCFEE 6388]
MPLDNTTDLSIAELAIYVTLIPPTIWLFFKHGRRASLAYIYLLIFQTLRIVAAGLQINAHRQHKTSTTGSILDAVGLSPLLLAFSGFLYEVGHYYSPPAQKPRRMLLEEILVHFGAYTGIALAAVGGSKLTESTASPSSINSAHHLQEGGSVLLLLTWVGIAYLCVRLCRNMGGFGFLTVLLLLARLFIGIRAVYSVVYAFDHSASVNPITGKFAIKLILVFLVQLLAVMALLAAGFLTRNIAKERPVGRRTRAGDVEEQGAPLRPVTAK